MAWQILLWVFAALGLLSVLWAALGWLLPGSSDAVLIVRASPGKHPDGVITRFCWLQSLGLVGPVTVAGSADGRELQLMRKKHPGIEFICLEEAITRLETERDRID